MSDCKRTEKGSAPLNSPPSEGLGGGFKVTFKEWCAAFSLFTAFLLSGINMFLPPFGEISDSVLWYTAQAFFFAGAALGIDTMIDRKLRGDR